MHGGCASCKVPMAALHMHQQRRTIRVHDQRRHLSLGDERTTAMKMATWRKAWR